MSYWKEFSRHLLAQHSGKPQEVAAITAALHSCEEALNVLARFGHLFHLESGPGVAPPEWPRLMFHVSLAPNGRLVRDEYEYDTMGDGWHDTSEAAQHDAGYDTQMTSRGGRPRRSRAIVVVERQLTEFERVELRDADRRAMRAAAKQRREENGTS